NLAHRESWGLVFEKGGHVDFHSGCVFVPNPERREQHRGGDETSLAHATGLRSLPRREADERQAQPVASRDVPRTQRRAATRRAQGGALAANVTSRTAAISASSSAVNSTGSNESIPLINSASPSGVSGQSSSRMPYSKATRTRKPSG